MFITETSMWVLVAEPYNSIEYDTFCPRHGAVTNARRVNQTYACNRRASKLQSWTDEHGCAIMTTERGALLCSHLRSVVPQMRASHNVEVGSGIWFLGGWREEEERVCWICAHDVECLQLKCTTATRARETLET